MRMGSGRLPASEQLAEGDDRDAPFHLGAGQSRSHPPAGLGGEWVETFVAGPWCSATRPVGSADPGEVVGHHHPKATDSGAQRHGQPAVLRLRRAAPDDAGVRRLHRRAGRAGSGDRRLFPRGGRVFLLGTDRLFSFKIGRGNALQIE